MLPETLRRRFSVAAAAATAAAGRRQRRARREAGQQLHRLGHLHVDVGAFGRELAVLVDEPLKHPSQDFCRLLVIRAVTSAALTVCRTAGLLMEKASKNTEGLTHRGEVLRLDLHDTGAEFGILGCSVRCARGGLLARHVLFLSFNLLLRQVSGRDNADTVR